jgi:hypothetical protein
LHEIAYEIVAFIYYQFLGIPVILVTDQCLQQTCQRICNVKNVLHSFARIYLLFYQNPGKSLECPSVKTSVAPYYPLVRETGQTGRGLGATGKDGGALVL